MTSGTVKHNVVVICDVIFGLPIHLFNPGIVKLTFSVIGGVIDIIDLSGDFWVIGKLNQCQILPELQLYYPVDVCADLSLKLFPNDDTPTEGSLQSNSSQNPKPEFEVEFLRIEKAEFGVDLELVDWRSKEVVAKLYATDIALDAFKEIYKDFDMGIAFAVSGAFQAIHGYLREPENFFKNKIVEKYKPGFSQ